MIKKKTVLFLSLMLALAGCGNANKSQSQSQDQNQSQAQNQNQDQSASTDPEAQLKEKSVAGRQYSEGNIGLLEANDTVYWYDGTRCLLNYLDESDMSWHVLCGKPNCTHTVEKGENNIGHTSDCDAFIERMFYSPLGYYDGRIYYVEGVPVLSDRWLSSVKADGTDHKREIEIEFQQGADGTQYYFHYGRLYVSNSFLDKNSTLTIYSLDDKKETKVTFDGYVGSLYLGEEFIYYHQRPLDDFSNTTLRRMTLDGTITDYQMKDSPSSIGCYFADDAVYRFLPEKGLFKTNYETGEETILWAGMADYDAPSFYLFSDGQYIYLRASGEDRYLQDDQHTLLVLDMDGNLIRDMDIVNTEEAKTKLKERLDSTEDKDLKAQYQNFYRHITANGTSSYDAFYGSIKGYVFSGNYAMPNQYISISDLTSKDTVPEWKDTTFAN